MPSVHWELLRESPGFSSDIGATRSVLLCQNTLLARESENKSGCVLAGGGGVASQEPKEIVGEHLLTGWGHWVMEHWYVAQACHLGTCHDFWHSNEGQQTRGLAQLSESSSFHLAE